MPECVFSRSGFFGKAEWNADDRTLFILPQAAPPETYLIRQIAGIRGDGYTIQLRYGGDELTLSRLGGDGPPLLDTLHRLWPVARANALRLAGEGEPTRFAARVSGATSAAAWAPAATPAAAGGATEPQRCHVLLWDDVLLLAREGIDLEPLFLSDLSDVTFDDATYSVLCRGWDGAVLSFSGLAGQTEAFLHALQTARAGLARDAAETLAAQMPALPVGPRTAISTRWLPGRLSALDELETIHSGFTETLRSGWIAKLPRSAEAAVLEAWAETGGLYAGYTGKAAAGAGTDSDQVAAAEAPHAQPAAALAEAASAGDTPGTPVEPAPVEPAPAADAGSPYLWLLANKGTGWLLENLSAGDHATYRFEGADEIRRMVGLLLCAPQFSRETLYLPLEELTGDRADFAIAARELPLLRELRDRFRGRLIHGNLDSWKAGLDR